MLHRSPLGGRRPRVLFVPNWRVRGAESAAGLQTPDFYPADGLYWFFRHFERPPAVDVLDAASWRGWALEERHLRLYAGQALQALLRARAYDLVFAFGAQSAVLLLAGMRALPRAARPKVLVDDAGCLNAGRPDRRASFQATRWALRGADRIVWHASATEGLMQRLCPELAARGEWFPFGASLADLEAATAADRASARPGAGDYALCAGNSPRAWAELVAAWPHDAGRALLLLNAPRQALPALPANVRALPHAPFHEYARLVAGARVVLLPLPDGWSSWGQMTLLQAMALGRPVVVTDVKPVHDYVGQGCVTVQAGRVDALVQAALDLWPDDERRRKLGAEAARAVREQFDERLMARRFESVIAGLLG